MKLAMKLALIRRQFSATGGAELYLRRLLRALGQAGHELHLFAEHWVDPPRQTQFHPVAVRGTRSTRPLHFAQAVRQAVAAQNFDCIFSLERTLQQDVYRAGDGVHRVWLEQRRAFAPWWKRPWIGRSRFHRRMLALEARTFSPERTGRIIVNSEMVKREILRHFSYPADRIHLVRNGIDVARFQRPDRAAARAGFGVRPDEFLLLFVGSGWERKGVRFLLEAMRLFAEGAWPSLLKKSDRSAQTGEAGRMPPLPADKIKLLVVGKGRRPRRPPANVLFCGPLVEVEKGYAAADLFTFLPIYEPSANVCLEALAAGLPVVTSIQNGAAESIESGINGTVLADPSDLPAVIDSIAYWWARRLHPPPVHANRFSLDQNVTETMAVLEEAHREKVSRREAGNG